MPEIVHDPTLIDDERARFTLWASNMEVFGHPNVSLDYRLRYNPTIVDIIHQLLDVICSSMKSLQPFDNPPQITSRKRRRISEISNAEAMKRVEDGSSDWDDDEDQARKNSLIFTYSIRGTVTRLFRLSNAIRRSAKPSRAEKIGEYRDNEEANAAIIELRLYTEYYIRFRFPQASEALRFTLIEANAWRLRRLYYQMSHQRRVLLSVQSPQANPRSVQLPKIPDGTPHVRFVSDVSLKPKATDESLKLTSVPPTLITYATTIQETAVRALYADPKILRAGSVPVNNTLTFPPIPTTSECPYCGDIVEFKGPKSTIDHVIRDLEPFVCIFAPCTNLSQQSSGPLTFETSKAWISHMRNAHGHAWECRAPSHDLIIFEKKDEFQKHSRNEHGVPEEYIGTLSSVARKSIPERILECPFGDGFSTQEKDGSSTPSPNEALYRHIAIHMKEILYRSISFSIAKFDPENRDAAGMTTLHLAVRNRKPSPGPVPHTPGCKRTWQDS
ncbi:hypothetical protein F4859DRAFT_512303 [Xylaria cf. heliscus]|nr:hypothetical protein F4859DRAFT_512303 [Xylaria cf. heliscus]